jgi:hypothetical protein
LVISPNFIRPLCSRLSPLLDFYRKHTAFLGSDRLDFFYPLARALEQEDSGNVFKIEWNFQTSPIKLTPLHNIDNGAVRFCEGFDGLSKSSSLTQSSLRATCRKWFFYLTS